MPTLQGETRRELSNERRLPTLPPPEREKQRKRMLIALGVLLVALFAVVLKDWDFWFPPSADGDAVSARTRKSQAQPAPLPTPSNSAHQRKPARAPSAESAGPVATVTDRAALPPLQVEVVAGNERRTLQAKNTAINVDVGAGPAAARPGQTVNTADRVQLSPQTAQSVTVPVAPNYPMLARQMKVQGAVILQALISREGTIEDLQVLSGPDILAAAAREAVKQWRFKPYYQAGHPVETQARITVNFTISTN